MYGKATKLKRPAQLLLKQSHDGSSGSEQVYDATAKVRNLTDDDKQTNELFAKWQSKMNQKKLAISFKNLNEQWLKYIDNCVVNPNIKFTNNQFKNMFNPKHIVYDKDWHVEFRNFLQLECEQLDKHKSIIYTKRNILVLLILYIRPIFTFIYCFCK